MGAAAAAAMLVKPVSVALGKGIGQIKAMMG
jgi:hypothetical protein